MRYMIFQNSPCPLLNISSIGCAWAPGCTGFGPGMRNLYIIHYVISGRGRFNGNPVGPGQGFLIRPGMQEHYFPDPEDPWHFLWFLSEDPAMANLLPLYRADPHTHIFQYACEEPVKALAEFLVSCGQTMYSGYDMLDFFLGIFRHQQPAAGPEAVKSNAQVYTEAAKAHILSNIHRPVTVGELAEFLGVSQPYLFRVFKARFQKSPKQYILEQKLRHAQTLLRETDLSVTHIAHSVGFPDVLSFSKCFRGKLGCSPQAYRGRMDGGRATGKDS